MQTKNFIKTLTAIIVFHFAGGVAFAAEKHLIRVNPFELPGEFTPKTIFQMKFHKPSNLRLFLLSKGKKLRPLVVRIFLRVISLLENVSCRYSKTESFWMTEVKRKT
jgi:hypothetical protein